MIGLETERLRFRLWKETDFESFANYFSDAENARYLGGIMSREEAWRLMASYLGHYQMKGFGYLAVEEKVSSRLVGAVGLWKSAPWPELELGYWLLQDLQGKGFGLEAAEKARDYAFEELQLGTFVSYIDPENVPSIKLALRLGAVYDKDIELLDFGVHRIYRYTK